MTALYYTHFNTKISTQLFADLLTRLPPFLSKRIKRLKRWEDSLASLYGKLLLLEALPTFKMAANLTNISYSEYGKPFFPHGSVCFNISHSGQYVVCAVSNEMNSLGVDIEQLREINFADFVGVWTAEELESMRSGDLHVFYDYWTKKEAIAKADGRGLALDLQTFDVRHSEVAVNNTLYYCQSINLDSNYIVNLASKQHNLDIALSRISSDSLLRN